MIVIVTVVIVVIATVVGAAILYILTSGIIIDGGGPTRPIVTFQAPVKSGGSSNLTANITVAGVSSPISTFSAFKGQISMDGVPLAATAITLQAGTIIAFGSTVKLIIRDLGGEGRLTTGDLFRIYGMTGTHAWRFSLIWASDGSQISASQWNSP
jgi:hypothetical protein